MKKIKIAYFGSPNFAADFLEKILLDKNLPVEVKLVITQPDQKVGRKQILTPTPVKIIAEKYNIKSQIINHKSQINNKSQITNHKHLEFGASNLFGTCNLGFSALKNINLALVYAYGDLIPKELLTLPKYGFWNIHPSLLPKYRGPSPIATPLINGDKTTGVTIIKMDSEIDHGPIIAQESLTVEDTDYRPDLEKKLTDLGFKIFKNLIKMGVEGLGIPTARSRGILSEASTGGKRHETGPVFRLTEQNHQLATYTKKLSKNDGFIEFENLKNILNNVTMKQCNNETIYNLFRGLHPWPGIWTILPNGKRLKITKITMKQSNNLTIDSVQLEGKNEVDFKMFNQAYNIL